jgi:DNA-binding transcriptional regulator YhcF (GntR family)
MARPTTEKIKQLREEINGQVKSGFFSAGSRFISARALSSRYKISYRSAHRLLAELSHEGLLERRHGSGSYVAGISRKRELCLRFGARAQRPASFEHQLVVTMKASLGTANVIFADNEIALNDNEYPIVWESPKILDQLIRRRQYGLLLNEVPPPGLASTFIDSISIDDFSGGVVAAEVAKEQGLSRKKVCVLAGPQTDPRSQERLRGFRQIFPCCAAEHAPSWYREEAYETVRKVLQRKPKLIFCANDGLAGALIDMAQSLGQTTPELIGFDNAPFAEEKNITSIAIPWDEMGDLAAKIAARRLAGEAHTATRRILHPRPVIRRSHIQSIGAKRGLSKPSGRGW